MKPALWIYLAGAGILLSVANGTNSAPIAAWLVPILLLRFSRTLPASASIPIVLFVFVAAFAFQFRGMFPVTGLAYLLFLMMFGTMAAFPYAVDRLLNPRLQGWRSTLAFPLAWVVIEFLGSYGPTASWGAVAYSQYGNLPLSQLLSVTGMAGIAFLIGWTASVINYAWDCGLQKLSVRRYVLLWSFMLLAVLVGGSIRITAFPPDTPTVRIAAIASGETADTMRGIIGRLQRHEATESEVATLRAWSNLTGDKLLERSEREARAGAKIVAWSEASVVVLKEDEEALLARGRAIASEYGVYLAVGILTWNRSEQRPAENKVVMIKPDGTVAWEFLKARPVPGPEATLSARGDRMLQVVDTPYGRLSAAICFDADFPDLLFQAGALDVDILIVPSNDWEAITPWHAQMASFRGIEQGFQMVRPTSNGLSVAYDYQGRRLGALNTFQSESRTMVVQVPIGGVRTWYFLLGTVFGWICLALLVLLTIQAFQRKPILGGARGR